MHCPACGTTLEPHRDSATVTVWECPAESCHVTHDRGGLFS